MKNRSSSAVLALVLLCFCTIGSAQDGYIRFVENLENVVLQAHAYQTILDVAHLVQTNLSKLSVRRTVDPAHEAIYLQKGYDLNKDGLLNQLDGFESVDGEKFSPWNYYIETMPCGEKEPFYFEVRALGKDSMLVYVQRLLTQRDQLLRGIDCVAPIKVYLPQKDAGLTLDAKDLIRGDVYDDCYQSTLPRDTLLAPLVKKFSLAPWYNDYYRRTPDSTQRYFELNCSHIGSVIPISVFAWDKVGNFSRCITKIEVLDSTGICPDPRPMIRLNDSLELILQKTFAQLRPTTHAKNLLSRGFSFAQFKDFKVRRSIRKANLAAWLQLGYDQNQDGQLNELDGFEVRQEIDFVLSPFLDSLLVFCTDFSDSLFIEVRGIDTMVTVGTQQWFKLFNPSLFVETYFGITKILTLKGGTQGEFLLEPLKVQEFLKSPCYTCDDGNGIPDVWGRKTLIPNMKRLDSAIDTFQQSIDLECCDAGRVLLLNIQARKDTASPAVGSVIAFAEIQDEKRLCPSDGCRTTRRILGKVTTSTGALMAGVKVKIERPEESSIEISTSAPTGLFGFWEFFWEYPPYLLITPSKTTDPLNGVSTFDLIQIQRHILNIKTFDSPYQYIAADINRSGTVTTLDLIQLRKVILGIDTNFANNSSWRFINVDHIFQHPTDPLRDYLPETIRIGPLNGIRNVEFVGIKIGDLNNSAIPK
ncbi:hypothetical protein [Haliscomenobacter sp.]|uniref:hypothetical protein n=1 Tax=Haliscomenobacter sp. TaxID=2717303 RepID=UPI003BAAB077